jgi:hypothetical protein
MVNDFFENINFYAGLNATLKAIILLIVALIAAAIARAIVRKIVKKFFADRTVVSDEETIDLTESKNSAVTILGNIAFAIVFLLFLPAALDNLNAGSVSSPLSSMATKFLNFIPNIIAAIIVIVFGVFFAKLAKELLTILLLKTKINDLQKKAGIKENQGFTFTDIIANIVYAVILVIFVIAALQVLNLKAISDPATQMVQLVFNYIPLVFAAIIIILFGVFLANIVGGLLITVLAGTGVDETTQAIFPKKADGTPVTTLSNLISVIVKIVINIFFIVAAIDVLKINVLTNIGNVIIAYLPNVLAAVIIVIVAWICANKASEAITKAEGGSIVLALIAKVAIIILAAFMAISQLGIGSDIVRILFIALALALSGAFILAFGIGGRAWAAKKLEELDASLRKKDNE